MIARRAHAFASSTPASISEPSSNAPASAISRHTCAAMALTGGCTFTFTPRPRSIHFGSVDRSS
ncbi:MAG: hypothetical protein D6773_16805, partial [Alphaproteobacteria bacterium]